MVDRYIEWEVELGLIIGLADPNCPDQLLRGDPKESPARQVEANHGLVALRGS